MPRTRPWPPSTPSTHPAAASNSHVRPFNGQVFVRVGMRECNQRKKSRWSTSTNNTREGKVVVHHTLFAQDILGQHVGRTHVEFRIKFALPHRSIPTESPTVELRECFHNLLGNCLVPSGIALGLRVLRGNCARNRRGSADCRQCRHIRRGRHDPVEDGCWLPPGVYLLQCRAVIVRSGPGSTCRRKRKC